MTIIAIDPGANTGWCVWNQLDGLIASAGLGVESFMKQFSRCDYSDWKAVYEHPEHRPGQRINPNDIITLAVRCGVVLGRLSETYGFSWRAVKPSEWKGSVPKRVHQQRFIKTLSNTNLERLEFCLSGLKKKDDVVDAVALAHWYSRKLMLPAFCTVTKPPCALP